MPVQVTIMEMAAVASLMSAACMVFGAGGGGSDGPPPAWLKEPLTFTGLAIGAFLGCMISAFWMMVYREHMKRLFSQADAEAKTAELEEAGKTKTKLEETIAKLHEVVKGELHTSRSASKSGSPRTKNPLAANKPRRVLRSNSDVSVTGSDHSHTD